MFEKAIAKDEILLISRILMMMLFVIFGWQKLIGFGAAAASFAGMGLPLPKLATLCAIGAELGFGMAIVLGFLTRPIAHPCWPSTPSLPASSAIPTGA